MPFGFGHHHDKERVEVIEGRGGDRVIIEEERGRHGHHDRERVEIIEDDRRDFARRGEFEDDRRDFGRRGEFEDYRGHDFYGHGHRDHRCDRYCREHREYRPEHYPHGHRLHVCDVYCGHHRDFRW